MSHPSFVPAARAGRREFLGSLASLAAAAVGAPALLAACDSERNPVAAARSATITVAAAGTRAAGQADFVASGSEAHTVIEQAMDAAAAASGNGRVLVMAGQYAHTSPILMLHSGVHLEFEPGAVLLPAT